MAEIFPSTVDTSSFTMQGGPTINTPLTVDPNIMPQYPKIPEVKGVSDDFKNFVENIRFDTTTTARNFQRGSQGGIPSWVAQMRGPDADKISNTTSVPLTETHTLLSDGITWIPKYKDYIPGTDNEDRLAREQSASEKFFNPVKRLISNTTKGVGDLVASVYGIGAAAMTGRFDSIYDNDFANALQDATDRTNFNYKNYYTKAQQDEAFGFNINSWDKALGGVEFTTRLLLGEAVLAAVTDGVSLPTTMAKWGARSLGKVAETVAATERLAGRVGRAARGLNTAERAAIDAALAAENLGTGTRAAGRAAEAAEEAAQVASTTQKGQAASKAIETMMAPEMSAARRGVPLSEASREISGASRFSKDLREKSAEFSNRVAARGKLADNLIKARFALTSPLYESGFEAKNFEKEARQDFDDYFKELGRDPTQKEINDFATRMSGAATGVFATNMAILAPSNLAIMGEILNISNPLSKSIVNSGKWFDRTILRIGTEVGENGTKQALKYGFWNRAAGVLSPTIKGALTEGVYEEGSQGIASSTFKNYVRSAYDPKAASSTLNYVDAFNKAFNDQFSTRQGQEEILIGALIGGLMGGIGGARSNASRRAMQPHVANVENMTSDFFKNRFNTSPEMVQSLVNVLSLGNKYQHIQERATQAENSADIIGKANATTSMLVALLEANHGIGRSANFSKMMQAAIEGLDAQSLSDATGLDLEHIEQYKQDQIRELREITDLHETTMEAGRYLYGKTVSPQIQVEAQDKNGKPTTRIANGTDYASALAHATVMARLNQNLAQNSFDAFMNKLATSQVSRDVVEKYGALGAIMAAGKEVRDRYKQTQNQLTTMKGQLTQAQDRLIQAQESDQDVKKIISIEQEIQNIRQQMSDLNNQKTALWDQMSSDFAQYGTSLTAPDFDTLSRDVENLRKSLDKLPGVDKAALSRLLDLFTQATEYNQSFSELVDNLTDPQTAYKTYNHLFASRRASFAGKSVSERTLQTFQDLLDISDKQPRMSQVDAQEYRSFGKLLITQEKVNSEDKPNLSDLMYVRNKQERGLELNDLEQQYYDKHQDIIESLNDTQDPLNPDSLENQINTLSVVRDLAQKKLDNLERGVYTPELQSKIDKINTQIRDLEQQIQELQNSKLEYTRAEYEDNVDQTALKEKQKQVSDQEDLLNNPQENQMDQKSDDQIYDIESGELQNTSSNQAVSKYSELNLFSYKNTDGTWGVAENIYGQSLVQGHKTRAQALKALDNFMQGKKVEDVDRAVTRTGEKIRKKFEAQHKRARTRELKKLAKLNEELAKEQEKLDRARTQAKQDFDQEEINKHQQAQQKFDQKKQSEIHELKNQIQDKKDSIEKAVEDEVMAQESLMLDLDDAEGRLNDQKNLRDEIKSLRNELHLSDDVEQELLEGNQTQSKDYRAKIRRINMLERRLADLQKNQTYSENMTPFEKLNWVMSNINSIKIENLNDEATRPSPEEIQEYIDLFDNKKRNTAQKQRLAELREKLLPHALVMNGDIDGMNLLDLLDLYAQSKKMDTVNNTQTNTVTETHIIEANQSAQNPWIVRSPKVGNVYSTARINRSGDMSTVHHIKLESFLYQSLAHGHVPVINVIDPETDTVTESFPVTRENVLELSQAFEGAQSIEVILSPELELRKSKSSPFFTFTGPLVEFMNLREYKIRGNNNSYTMLYDQKSDGTWGPKAAEFTVSIDGVEIPFDSDVLNSLKPGDVVTLEFNPNDDFNKTLDKKDRASKGNIYVRKNGSLVQVLKETSNRTEAGGEWDNLIAIRKQVIDAYTNKKPAVQLTITNSYLGDPMISINQQGNAIEHQVDESLVVGYGYIDADGKIHSDTKGSINTQYIDPFVKDKQSIAFAVFEKYGKKFAFPINLRTDPVNLTYMVDEIVQDNLLTQERKMFEVNRLLEEHDMFNSDTAVTYQNPGFDNAREALRAVNSNVDFANSDEVKAAHKTSFIDFNAPFDDSKLVFQLSDDPIDPSDLQEENRTITTTDGSGIAAAENNTCIP